MMVDLSNQRIVNRAHNGNEGATVYAIAKWVALTGCAVALLLTSAAIRNQILSVQYDVAKLRMDNRRLIEQNDLLRAELQSLTAPARIEATAVELGLISSNDDRVLLLEAEGFTTDQQTVAHVSEPPGTVHE